MASVAKTVEALALPIAGQLGLEIWNVEYKKEGGMYILRIYIDKQGENVSINDCTAFSQAIDPVLDEADPIQDSYYLEVSSAGLDRELSRPEHFERYIGSSVDVKLYKVIDGNKAYTGNLVANTDETVTINTEEKEYTFDKKDVATVRLTVII